MQACSCAVKSTAWQWLSDNRLIPSRRSVTPISRGNANALGSPNPGAFCFWRLQGIPMYRTTLRNPFRPEASGWTQPRQGRGCDRRMCAASRCFGAGCAGTDIHESGSDARTYCRLAAAGNQEHRTDRPQRHGLKPHPVRAAMPPAYAGACRAVFHNDDVGSEAERQVHSLQVAGSNPARQPLDSSDG